MSLGACALHAASDPFERQARARFKPQPMLSTKTAFRVARHLASCLCLVLLIFVPACGGGGGGGGGLPGPDPLQTSFTASTSFGTSADGAAEVILTVRVVDRAGTPLEDVQLEFRATGYGNEFTQPALTDVDGVTAGVMRSSAGEPKTVEAVALLGASERSLGTLTTEFIRILPDHYFVRAGGADSSSGRSPLDAWSTPEFALTQLEAGDTLHVGAGTYGAFEVTKSGTSKVPLRILADRAGEFTGDPGEVAIDAGGGLFGIRIDGASNLLLSGFSVHGANPGAQSGGGLQVTSPTNKNVTITGCSFYENSRGVEIRMAFELVLEGNRISRNTGDGILLQNTLDSSVTNNLIYANGGAGLVSDEISTNLTVGYNTFYRNAGDQIREAGSGTTGIITGNIFAEGGSNSISLLNNSNLSGDVNLSFANQISGGLAPLSSLSIIADPLFSNAFGADGVLGGFGTADDDFRLRITSPALDIGNVDARELTFGTSGPASVMTSRLTDLRDGSGIDGDLINLGFHYGVPLDPLLAAERGAARLVYALPREATLHSRQSPASASGASNAPWTKDQEIQNSNSNTRWVVHRLAPGTPEELIAALAETGSGTELHVRHWDGRSWNAAPKLPPVRTIRSANAGERGFDIAYEAGSNDALLVHSNDDPNPLYRTLSAGIWSEPQPVFTVPLGIGSVLWVELVSDPTSDRIALVALDDAAHLSTSIWDGDAWTQPLLLETTVVESRQFRSFDVAFESISGDLLVAWGFSIFAEQARLAILPAASGPWITGRTYTNSEAVGSLIRLRSDPTSDRLVAAFGEGTLDDDVVISIWDGDQFVETKEVSLFGDPGQHSIEVGWIGNTGKAFAIWRNPDSNTFRRASFDRNWHVEAPVLFPNAGTAVRLELAQSADTDRSALVMLDSSGALFGLEVHYDQKSSHWNLTNQGLPLAEGFDPAGLTKPFSLDRRLR